ncbi:unnamed protein product [Mytilus edulis]|uniref:Uncharacterized protein n=1 Tax=Mytilus edulis TaxID=6550 RepID=A0A8S3PMU6_MYTED|nr:unnamed protein product [Mytilus edulis]
MTIVVRNSHYSTLSVGMAAIAEPKSMTRAKQWSDEVEEAYRFQLAGYRDAIEYQIIQKKDIDRWPHNGYVKKLQRKDGCLSVVDYCVVPYESLCHYNNFKVIRASVLCNKSAQPGSFRANHIPDHSVLCWEFETNFDNINEICSIDLSHSAHNSVKQQNNTYVSYDVKNIPNDWMTNNDILDKINMCIDNIQCSKGRQFEVDKLYNNFVEILHSEMNDKLETKVKVLNSTNNRKRRIKKPWWNDKLTNKWNIVCTAKRDYVTCKQGSLKQQLRKDFVDKRKDFDKLTQKYKRQYWYRCQEELVNFSDNDTNQFWRRIGQIGIGNERQMRIPNEVTLDDGTISNNLETVLNKWKSSFHSLLNPNVDATDYNKVENCILKENIICIDLDKEITIDEVHKVVMNAKNFLVMYQIYGIREL